MIKNPKIHCGKWIYTLNNNKKILARLKTF